MKIALGQINFTIGDFEGNFIKIIDCYDKAVANGMDLVLYPELAITGYMPEDLLFRQDFLNKSNQILVRLEEYTIGKKTAIIIGAPYFDGALYNAAIVISNGRIEKVVKKTSLPNRDVFDECRYFEHGGNDKLVRINDKNCLILICEDMWHGRNLEQFSGHAEFVIVINASPFEVDKFQVRIENAIIALNITKAKFLFYVNNVGGQDSLVFDGNSFVISNDQQILLKLKDFAEDYAEFDSANDGEKVSNSAFYSLKRSKFDQIYHAILLGTSDYFRKNRFKKAVIGLSGGADSAIVATIALDILGKDNVRLVMMPSKFTSKESYEDGYELCKNLFVEPELVEIGRVFDVVYDSLHQLHGTNQDKTEENIQSRIRGLFLMSISNKFNEILLTTGNKSELAVGYSTIYGDMCGGFNPIKDLYKTEIYELAKWRNANIPNGFDVVNKVLNVIPVNILVKEPSAELRHDQKDSDNLPKYEILDKILFLYIENKLSVEKIAMEIGIDVNKVSDIVKLVNLAEYKRKQSPIGLKLSTCSFDKGWRYPITKKF